MQKRNVFFYIQRVVSSAQFLFTEKKVQFFHHKRNKSKRNEALASAEFFIDPEIDLACMVGTLYEAELKSEREIAGSSL